MAVFQFNQPVDLVSGVSIYYGVVSSYDRSQITITSGNLRAQYRGDFSYDELGNVYGRLNAYYAWASGVQTGAATQLDLNANTFYRLLAADNVDGLLALAFGRSDRITGSYGADRLAGLDGNDLIYGGDGRDTLYGGNGSDTLGGGSGNDLLYGDAGDDRFLESGGDDFAVGGSGTDTVVLSVSSETVSVRLSAGEVELQSALGTDRYTGIEYFQFSDRTVAVSNLSYLTLDPPSRWQGTEYNDSFTGGSGSDTIIGYGGNDTLRGMDGADEIHGGYGDDFLYGGGGQADLRDLIFGDAGNDSIQGGYGNDELHGGFGNDTIDGQQGADWVIGNEGDDVLSGGALSDLIYGGAGSDFISGGFGFDRYNGGAGADRFFHFGVAGHGTDWVQDYDADELDTLLFGIVAADGNDFQVNYAYTPNAGASNVAEAFVIYRPTEQIIWALVDGAAQEDIFVQINYNGTNTLYDVA